MAEAAGLVLGAFPLVVGALQLYIKGIKAIKKWSKYAKLLGRIVRALITEKGLFENSLLRLLYDCADFIDIEDLLREPAAEMWREESLQDSFRVWLGRSFDNFTGIVDDMTNTFGELSEKLGLDAEYRVQQYHVRFLV